MENVIQNFHFLRPWLLLLLFLPIIFYGYYFKSTTAQSSWQKVIDKKLLDFLLIKGSASKRKLLIITALIGSVFAVIAAAGPTFSKVELPSYEIENPVMIVLNMSSDMRETDLAPSRLSRAKYKINDFLALLEGGQVGLEVYSDEPFVISPLTDDVNILQNLLPAIDFDIMPSNGDRLDRAIELGVSKIKSSGFNKGRLLIFTPDVGQKFDMAIDAAKKAEASGIIIDVIGVTSIPNEKLAYIATAGNGQYWNLQTDDSRIAALATELNKTSDDLTTGKNKRSIWLDSGWYLLCVPLFCCLIFFRKGILAVSFIMLSSNAYAGFFLNSDQEGLHSFNNYDYTSSAAQFKDDKWKAASLYRLGDYQKAYKLYQKDNSPTGLYNQGNALAKGGKINEAIAKYEQVLKQVPEHKDARFNLEYLKQQQQQNQQQQPNQSNNDKNQNNESQQASQQNQEQNNQQTEPNNQEQNQNAAGEQNSQNEQQSETSRQENSQQDKNSDNQEDNANNERQSSTNELDEQKQQLQGQQQSGASVKYGDKKEDEYNEQMQAKAQQYREIPEDPGGLLKAFIYQEYSQNRYNKQ